MRTAAAVLALLLPLAAHAAGIRFGAVLTEEFANPGRPSQQGHVATLTLNDARNALYVEFFARTVAGSVDGVQLLERGNPVLDLTPFLQGRRIDATVPIDPALGNRLASANPADYQLVATNAAGTLTRLDASITWAGELREAGGNRYTGAFAVTLDYTNRLIVHVNSLPITAIEDAHLHRGNDVFLDLTGRLSHEVTLTEALAAGLRAHAEEFSIDIHAPAVTLRGGFKPAHEYDMAVAGRTGPWKTDVRIFNRSFDSDVVVLVEYFEGGPFSNLHPDRSITVRIPRRGTAILDDISTHLAMASGTGALRISAISPLVATSRISNDRRYGQFVPAIPRENTLRHGVLTQLAYRVPTKARTNLGIFNPNETEVHVRLAAHRPEATGGGPFYTKSLTVGPRSQQQASITDYFRTEQINGDDLTVTFDASAPLIVYASVIDLVSLDPIFVPPQPD